MLEGPLPKKDHKKTTHFAAPQPKQWKTRIAERRDVFSANETSAIQIHMQPRMPSSHYDGSTPPRLLRGTDILPALAVALGPDMLPQLATTPMTA
jgi:hypothetical protein